MNNHSTDIDWNAIAAMVAIVAAILSPILTAILNNWHQRKLKRLELEYQSKLKTYEDKRIVFEEFTQVVGNYFQFGKCQEDFGGIVARILLYLPDSLQKRICDFYDSIDPQRRLLSYPEFLLIARELSEELGLPPRVPR